MGSGRLIQRAIKKHGKENFKKEILYSFSTESEMNQKEKELVTEDFCLRDDTYNLCVGGQGGFSYINRSGLNNSKRDVIAQMKKLADNRRGKRCLRTSKMMEERHRLGLVKYDNFTGKTHSEETKRIIGNKNSKRQSGSGNSQFGTCWITNGTENSKISKFDHIPDGWNKGRTLKK